ncbi:MAG: hypothetical protein H6512_11730 [Acidimicrobiia bacterium]|nr:hypothetical protein [Acidimicrobiia bacterium]
MKAIRTSSRVLVLLAMVAVLLLLLQPLAADAEPLECANANTYTGDTVIDTVTTSPDLATKTATGSMTIQLPSGPASLDFELSTTYRDPNGNLARNTFSFVETSPTAARPYAGGISTWGQPTVSNYTFEVAMNISNVTPPDSGLRMIMYGQEFSSQNGNSAFDTYSITALDSAEPAYIYDPANQLRFNGNPIPATGQPLEAGEAFTQIAIIPNNTLQWYVALPADATQFNFTASRGNVWEGFNFTAGAVNLCPPVANDDSASVSISPSSPAVIDVIAGTITDAVNDQSNPIVSGTPDEDPDGIVANATVTLIDPVTGSPTTDPVVVSGEGTYEVVDNKVVFTPVASFTGTTTPISYQLTDVQGLTATASIQLDVTVALVPPVAVDDAAVTDPGVPVGIDVVGNDTDADGSVDPTTVMLIDPVTQEPTSDPVTIPGEGTYEVDPVTGEVTFTPEDGFVGESTVDYVVADDDGNVSDPATITVTVQAPLVPPVAVDDDAVTEPGVPVGIDVVGNDSDSDGVIDPTTVMLIDPVTQEPTSDESVQW